jgi:tetratricopeptide (TPR) repeat protein
MTRNKIGLMCLVIVAAGAIVYLNSFTGVFLLDDNAHIVDKQDFLEIAGRRPVVNLTLALSYALSGLDTWGYHLVNVIVHLLAGLTLFGVVRRTLGLDVFPSEWRARASWVALTVALIWVVHPLQTQSVTYIIQRAEALMTLFYLLTIYCVIRGAGSPRAALWYGAAVLAAGLGMGSKAVMVTAPVVVLLYDRIFLSPSFGELLRRRWGLYASLGGSWLILAICGVVQGVFSTSAKIATVGFGVQSVTPGEYLMSQPGVILNYLWLSVFPRSLCLDYGWPVAESAVAIVVPLLVIGALLAATIWALRFHPRLGFLGAVFFLILAPTSSIVPIRDLAFEHRMYLPLAAVVLLVVVAAVRYVPRRTWRVAIAVAVITVLGIRTIDRNRDYRSAHAMWTNAVTQRPENARAHIELANALDLLGQPEQAIAHYQAGVRLEPNEYLAHNNLGRTLASVNRLEEAVGHYEKSLELNPEYFFAHNNLGNTLVKLDRVDEGLAHIRKALEIRRKYPTGYNSLGVILAGRGDLDGAEKNFRKAARLDPTYAEARGNLASILRARGDLEQAVVEYRASVTIRPDYFDGWYNLGTALLELGRRREAEAALAQARRLRPDHPALRSLMR